MTDTSPSQPNSDEILHHLKSDGKGGHYSSNITFDPKSGKAQFNLEKKKKNVCLMPPPNAIPIIFVPDFMGTNLKSSKEKYKDTAIWQMNDRSAAAELWKRRDPAQRKDMLNPEYLSLDSKGQLPEGTDDLSQEEMKNRGWGDISYFMYGEFLKWLNEQMNDFVVADVLSGSRYFMTDNVKYGNFEWFKEAGQSFIKDKIEDFANSKLEKFHMEASLPEVTSQKDADLSFYDAEQIKESLELSLAEWANSYDYVYPVYAFGYNWMESQIDSANKLAEKIDEILKKEQSLHSGEVKKVILITHGSGGLIARYCSKKKAGEIAGIIHVAMPTTGLPQVYRRIKKGSVLPDKTYHAAFFTDTNDDLARREHWTDLAKDVVSNPKKAFSSTGQVVVQTTVRVVQHDDKVNKELDEDSIIDGREAEDVASMASESVGYLQMLPFKEYGRLRYEGENSTDSQWLTVQGAKEKSLPTYNPFTEIYLSQDFWGLYNKDTMNPKGQDTELFVDYTQIQYNLITQVEPFQTDLSQFFHTFSFAIFGKEHEDIANTPHGIKVTNQSVSDTGNIYGDELIPMVSYTDIPSKAMLSRFVCIFRHRNAFTTKIVQYCNLWSITKLVSALQLESSGAPSSTSKEKDLRQELNNKTGEYTKNIHDSENRQSEFEQQRDLIGKKREDSDYYTNNSVDQINQDGDQQQKLEGSIKKEEQLQQTLSNQRYQLENKVTRAIAQSDYDTATKLLNNDGKIE